MRDEQDYSHWALAMGVHLFTASGGLLAFLALAAAIEGDLRATFGWLAAAFVVDGVDGSLARWVGVDRHAPRWDGAVLDLVIDFLTYVLTPLVAIWRAGLLPESVAIWFCGAVAMASAMYFADRRMKTPDKGFRGFPALWNVLALYLFGFPMPEVLNLIVMAIAAAAMFAPFEFVHPLRVRRWRPATIAMTVIWLLAAADLVMRGFGPATVSRAALLASGVYFLSLPLLRRSNPFSAREPGD